MRCTDFKYMHQSNLRLRYNCSIIDLYDRSIISSINGIAINKSLAIKTLKDALKKEKNPRGLIFYSDQEAQFSSQDNVVFCKGNGIT